MNSYVKLSPEARKEVDATVQVIKRDVAPELREENTLRFLLANLVRSCAAADGQDAWQRMYYDHVRRFEGEALTDQQIAEKAQTHREFLVQEGQLRV